MMMNVNNKINKNEQQDREISEYIIKQKQFLKFYLKIIILIFTENQTMYQSFKFQNSEDFKNSLKKAQQLAQRKNILKINLKNLYSQSSFSKPNNTSSFTINSDNQSRFQTPKSTRNDEKSKQEIIYKMNDSGNKQIDMDKSIKNGEMIRQDNMNEIISNLQKDMKQMGKICEQFKRFQKQMNMKLKDKKQNEILKELRQEDKLQQQNEIQKQNRQLKLRLQRAEQYIKVLKVRNDKLILHLKQQSKYKQVLDPIHFIQQDITIHQLYTNIINHIQKSNYHHQQLNHTHHLQLTYQKYIKKLKKKLCKYFKTNWQGVKLIIDLANNSNLS